MKSIDPEVVHGAARLRFVHETRILRELSGSGLCAAARRRADGDIHHYLAQQVPRPA